MPEYESRGAKQETARLESFYHQVNAWLEKFKKTDGDLSRTTGEIVQLSDIKINEADREVAEIIEMYKKFLTDFDFTISSIGGKKKIQDTIQTINTKLKNIQEQLHATLTSFDEGASEKVDVQNRIGITHFLVNRISYNYSVSVDFDKHDTPEGIAQWSKKVEKLNKELFGIEHV